MLCFGVATAAMFLTMAQKNSFNGAVYSMYIENSFAGTTQSPKSGMDCYNKALSMVSEVIGKEAQSEGNIKFCLNAARVKADNAALTQNIYNAVLDNYSKGTALYIDNELISVNLSESVVKDFVSTLENKALDGARLSVPGKIENIEITSDIQIQTGYFLKDSFKTNEYLYSLQNTLVESAMMLRTTESVKAESRLTPAFEMQANGNMPAVEYDVSYTTEVKRDIPHNVEYILDDTRPAGEVEIIEQGCDGVVKEITLTTITKDGQVSIPYGEEIVKQPVDGIVSIGTALQINSPSPSQDSGFAWPYDGMVFSDFGPRSSGNHAGIDICGPEGSVITAAKDGVVVFSGYKDNGYGNYIIIQHNDEEATLYSHNKSNSVEVGDYVVKGQEIAKMGMTGRASGNHVHFEIIINGVKKNPEDYLPKRD